MKNQIQEKSEKKWKGGLFELFWSFFKIGLFTFGGGYAMIPLIQKEAVESKKWISDDDILEIIAIAESTPGPIAINSATFVGYRVRGFWGSFFATLGVVMPSFLIILAIAFVLKEFQSIAVVKYAFWGIRAGVLALIFKAVVNMYKKSKKNLFSHIVMISAFFIVAFFNVNVIFVIIGCALAGLISALVAERRAKK